MNNQRAFKVVKPPIKGTRIRTLRNRKNLPTKDKLKVPLYAHTLCKIERKAQSRFISYVPLFLE